MSETETNLQSKVRWLRVLFLAVWVAAGISMASLKWDWSVDFLLTSDQDYMFKDNTLDKQRVGLNRWLIIGYSSLALLGFAGVASQGSIALPSFRTWHLLPICLLMWCGASLFWSFETSLTIRRIGHLYMAVLGGVGLASLLNRREILWAILLSMTSIGLVGFAAEFSLGMLVPWRSGYRFCGIGHPNETALFAVTAILAGRVLWLLEAQRKRAALLNLMNVVILLVMFNFAVVILTKSRTTLFSGIAALMVIQYVYAKSLNAWLFLFSGTSAALIVALFLSMVPTSVYNAFFGIATVGRTTHVASLTGRIPLWEEIIRLWQREPMLGYGYGGFWTTKRVEDFAQMFYWEPPNGHSIYIDSLVETGPVGFVLLIATLAALFFASLAEYPKAKQLNLLFVAGLTTMILVHGLAESSFFKGCFGPLMFAVAIAMLTSKDQSVTTA